MDPMKEILLGKMNKKEKKDKKKKKGGGGDTYNIAGDYIAGTGGTGDTPGGTGDTPGPVVEDDCPCDPSIKVGEGCDCCPDDNTKKVSEGCEEETSEGCSDEEKAACTDPNKELNDECECVDKEIDPTVDDDCPHGVVRTKTQDAWCKCCDGAEGKLQVNESH